MYSRDANGNVVLTMTRDDFEGLLFTLGGALTLAREGRAALSFEGLLALVNRLNEGNPQFTPYEIARCGHCGAGVADPEKHVCEEGR